MLRDDHHRKAHRAFRGSCVHVLTGRQFDPRPDAARRGVMSCHNAIWEQAAALIKADVNPDKLAHDALAADLTNHLVAGVVLIPGASATMPELQQAGFHYAK